MNIKRFVNAFFRRLKNGQIKSALYLTYYYLYLYLYDLRFGVDFANSQNSMEAGAPFGSTGNFPAHPRIVEMFINAAKIKFDESILDVGHGSGMVLHVADRMGYKFLSGIEYSEVAFALSRNNLSGSIKLIHGDANNLDLTPYSTIFFFSPFRGNLAEIFFNRIPENIKIIITINHDLIIEKILNSKGFNSIYTYQHCIYKNFNGKIWKR